MSKKLLLIILVVVLMGGGGGGYFIFSKSASAKQTEKKAETEKTRTKLELLELPEFVVNLQDKLRSHYLKTTVVLEISGGGSEKLKELTPYLRDAVITTLSRQEYELLLTERGKSELKRELLVCIQKLADKADAKVSNVLFTSFVMD